MKKQTGMWMDVHVWEAYRGLCGREKLRPGEPIEEFVKFVLAGGSALGALSMMRTMTETKSESFEAYARVLLDWTRKEISWVHVMTGDYERNADVDYMLLEALKQVTDPQLRKEIEDALKNSRMDRRKIDDKEDEEEEEDDEEDNDDNDEEEEDEPEDKPEKSKFEGMQLEAMEQRLADLKKLKARMKAHPRRN